jgi:hypothetical protein
MGNFLGPEEMMNICRKIKHYMEIMDRGFTILLSSSN